jgi:hypothetical protein
MTLTLSGTIHVSFKSLSSTWNLQVFHFFFSSSDFIKILLSQWFLIRCHPLCWTFVIIGLCSWTIFHTSYILPFLINQTHLITPLKSPWLGGEIAENYWKCIEKQSTIGVGYFSYFVQFNKCKTLFTSQSVLAGRCWGFEFNLEWVHPPYRTQNFVATMLGHKH